MDSDISPQLLKYDNNHHMWYHSSDYNRPLVTINFLIFQPEQIVVNTQKNHLIDDEMVWVSTTIVLDDWNGSFLAPKTHVKTDGYIQRFIYDRTYSKIYLFFTNWQAHEIMVYIIA